MRLLLVLTLFTASVAATAQVTQTVDRSGRYPIIRVAGEAPRWRLDSLATLSDSGVGFEDVKGVLIDPAGGALVLDRKRPALYRFDEQGKLLGIIGRKGSGPKEYDSPNAIGWVDKDLMLFDPGNGRVVRWNRTGDFVAQWTFIRLTGEVPLYSAGPSNVWLRGVLRADSAKLASAFVRLPYTGRGDTIRIPARPNMKSLGFDCVVGYGKDSRISVFSVPFTAATFSVRPTPDANFVELGTASYRVAIKNQSGDTLKVLERTLKQVPIADTEWEDSTKKYREFRSKNPLANCEGSMARPQSKPTAIDMMTDDQGRIWVERPVENGTLLEIWKDDRIIGAIPGVNRRHGTSDAIDIRGDRMAIARSNPDDGGTVVVLYKIVPR
jgi:hypothetical protein